MSSAGDSKPEAQPSAAPRTEPHQRAPPRTRAVKGCTLLCKVLVVGNAKCGKTSIIRRFASDSFESEYATTVGADFVRRDIELDRPAPPPGHSGDRGDKGSRRQPVPARPADGADSDAKNAPGLAAGIAGTGRGTVRGTGRGPRGAASAPAATPAARRTVPVRLQLWDIAGQDRFARLTRAYFRNAKAAAIVCDLTRMDATCTAVRQWKREIDTWGSADGNGGASGGVGSGDCAGGGGGGLPVVLFANKCDLLECDAAASVAVGARMEALCRDLGIRRWFVTSAKDGANVEAGFTALAGMAADRDEALATEAGMVVRGSAGGDDEELKRPRQGAAARKRGPGGDETPPHPELAMGSGPEVGVGVAPSPKRGGRDGCEEGDAGLLTVWDIDDF